MAQSGSVVITKHIQINIQGMVQGVGFRPFVYRLAHRYGLKGWVANTGTGVSMALEGKAAQQEAFIAALPLQLPPYAEIDAINITALPVTGFQDFEIKSSSTGPNSSSFVLPDIALCKACVDDLYDPNSRFYRYPFTSCSYCGPRYSILAAQPYDRSQTAMAAFDLCPACLKDYQNPADRRFHAQTLACSECGPQLQLYDAEDVLIADREKALKQAVCALQDGFILAVKGIGGYQLLADAGNSETVNRLRARKNRGNKPFAVMFPSLAILKQWSFVSPDEQQALTSAAAPIVLLQCCLQADAITAIAPGLNLLGAMLPYSPLHHLLLHDFGGPVIATSGNRLDEPICIDHNQAVNTLHGIADFFLSHNRAILRPLDDSIVRFIGDITTVLRRARGYVPKPVTLQQSRSDTVAVGGHLKNTLAFKRGKHVVLSQHLGDLDLLAGRRQFQATFQDMQTFFQVRPKKVMYDLHPGYFSSEFATQLNMPGVPVQHHYAHGLACMAEHGLKPPVLGIVWDGSGLGDDQTLWGGEFLLIHEQGFDRFAHFRSLPLPGGVKAIREPRRMALAILYELYGEQIFEWREQSPMNAFSQQERIVLKTLMNNRMDMQRTTSVGRLFDAVAALSGLCHINSYEGEAAMRLESVAWGHDSEVCYPFTIQNGQPQIIDWQLTMTAIMADFSNGLETLIPMKFHNTLVEMALSIAQAARQRNVVISGGCFQNACLVTKMQQCLHANGFKVFQHRQVPPNDGGLALGQLAAAMYLSKT